MEENPVLNTSETWFNGFVSQLPEPAKEKVEKSLARASKADLRYEVTVTTFRLFYLMVIEDDENEKFLQCLNVAMKDWEV